MLSDLRLDGTELARYRIARRNGMLARWAYLFAIGAFEPPTTPLVLLGSEAYRRRSPAKMLAGCTRIAGGPAL